VSSAELLLEAAKEVLKKVSASVDEAAVLLTRSKSVMVKLFKSQPSVVQSWSVVKASVYVGKSGRVAVFGAEAPSLEDVVKMALGGAEGLELLERSEYDAPLPEPEKLDRVAGAFEERVAKLLEDPEPLLDAVFNAVLAEEAEVAGAARAGVVERALATSKGFEGSEEGTFVDGYFRVFGKATSGQWAFASTKLDERAMKVAAERARYYASFDLPLISLEPGKRDALLSPMVVANLANVVASMASAMAVDAGMSVFAKFKPGDAVASEGFSLYDVPRNAQLPGCASFDDEGLRTFDKPVVERGAFKTLLHNAKTAAKRGERSTANAGWLWPRPWVLEVAPGDLSEEEAAEALREGVIVTNNWYTRLQNYLEGEFSTVARDAVVYVRGGKPAGLVPKLRIADALPSLMKSVEAATKERYQIAWWEVDHATAVPFLLVRGLGVTSKA